MGRLSEELIERIKREVSLVRLLESQGYAPVRQGKDWAVGCPFHEGDDTPSLIVTPEKNLFHCFGCNASGSVIDWVMQTRGVSFRHAVELLLADIPLAAGASASATPPKRGTVKQLPPPLATAADDQAALAQVIDYYHGTLKQSPEALEYLKRRGLDHPALIEQFKLGYANRTLGYRLPDKNRKVGLALRSQLQRLGILRDSGHEHFNGSLVVPVMDDSGAITEVYGRKLRDDLRKGTAKHLYLPGPHRGVWNLEAVKASREVILCEALIDAMTFWVHGYRNVTAAWGTSGFTDDHLAAFQAHGVERVLIAYDRDKAGDQAAEKLAKQLSREGIATFRIQFPKGLDANEYALKVTPAAKSLGLVIRKAEWLGDGRAPAITTAGSAVEARAVAPVEAASPADQAPPAVHESGPTAAKGESIESTSEPSPLAAEAAETAEPPVPTTASPLPETPQPVEPEKREHELILTFGDRRYRVRGLTKNTSYDQLKVNVLVSREARFHVDTLDLYSARHRAAFVKQAAVELGVEDDVVKRDLGQVLLTLELKQDEQIQAALAPNSVQVELTDEEKSEALAFLKAPDLLDRILADFEAAGVVGEATNKLVGYLACVSRKLDKPLAIVIQSASAAGKSSLLDAVLAFMPAEDRVQYSAMTGQSLFYMGETDLKHKILAIAEDAGAEQAAYALKLLQSEGEITIASTGKDASTGQLKTQVYRVEGPVMLCLTTTAIDVDEELVNRCLVLTVNETRDQTQAIHRLQRQRETLGGLLADAEKHSVLRKHQNAQRLLRPLLVANPYAEQLTFLDDKTRTRRDHLKYLTLIRTIALLHQHQRPVKHVVHQGQRLAYIEVTLDDIGAANHLAHEVLGRTLDELPPQTRKLLEHVHGWVSERTRAQAIERSAFRFSRRDVREVTGWGNTQLKLHLRRLEELEYVLMHRGGRGQAFEYELVYDGEGQDGEAFALGLCDVERLAAADWSGAGRGVVGGESAPGRPDESLKSAACSNGYASSPETVTKAHRSGAADSGGSYRNVSPLAAWAE
jgi:DNA primase catalytic core